MTSTRNSFFRWTQRPKLGVTFVALALLSAGAGCNSHTVKVDSLVRANAEQAISYRIQNKRSLSGSEPPSLEEAAAYVRTALAGRGFYEAPSNVKADLVVELDYGVGPPVGRFRVVDMPEYSTKPRKIVEQGGMVESVPPPVTIRQTTITVTTYEKYLRLTARENLSTPTGRPPNEIWAVDATSTGESSDLSKHLPVLVAACIDYIGRDTHGQKTIQLKDSDADVVFVKKGK